MKKLTWQSDWHALNIVPLVIKMQWKCSKLQTVCMGNLINHALIKQDTKELCLFSNTFTLSGVCSNVCTL